MDPAASARDPRVARAVALLREPRDGLVALDHPELVAAALDEGLVVEEVIAADPHAWGHVDAPVVPASPDALRALGALGQPAEVVAIARLPEPPPSVPPGALVLAGLGDAGNIGSICRSVAGLSSPGAAITPDTASPWSRKALRASRGASLRRGLVAPVPSLAAVCLPLAAAVPRGGVAPSELPPTHAVVLGNEHTGLSREQLRACDLAVTIPAPGFESLNVAAAAAILLWELRCRG